MFFRKKKQREYVKVECVYCKQSFYCDKTGYDDGMAFLCPHCGKTLCPKPATRGGVPADAQGNGKETESDRSWYEDFFQQQLKRVVGEYNGIKFNYGFCLSAVALFVLFAWSVLALSFKAWLPCAVFAALCAVFLLLGNIGKK